MRDVMVGVHGFRKCYGTAVAVKGIDFEVRQGEIFALLGPNGSGKTSTLESLEGLRQPDGGTLRVGGVDPTRQQRKLRNVIGVQLQTSSLPPAMTADEAMKFFCAYHGVAPREDLIERLGLSEKRGTQYGQLSVGQQRRLALAIAVAHGPKVLFLDEPTAGLDVQSRAELHALVAELRQEGTTILLATHDMAEAEKLADRAAILLRRKDRGHRQPAPAHRNGQSSDPDLGVHGERQPGEAGWCPVHRVSRGRVPGNQRPLRHVPLPEPGQGRRRHPRAPGTGG